MKPLLLIGAALMAGAGIYGFVDYKKANHRKEFQSLYKDEPKDVVQPQVFEPVTPVPEVTAKGAGKRDIVMEQKKLDAISKKYESKPPKIQFKEFSRAALEKEEVRLPEREIKVAFKKDQP